MSKSKAVAKAENTAIAIPEDVQLPDHAGLEHADSESFAIPFLQILQKGSPQCDDDDPNYNEDAKPGMLIDTVAEEIIDLEQEVVEIIPVSYARTFTEWALREAGGGFKGEYDVPTGLEMLKTTVRDEKNRDVLPNGNQIVDTRKHYIIAIRGDGLMMPMLITMASTQLKKSKRLNSDCDLQMRAHGLKATFQLKYKLGTVGESNDKGSWKGWKIERAGFVEDQDQFDAALAFFKSIQAGEVKEATDSLGGSEEAPNAKSDYPDDEAAF